MIPGRKIKTCEALLYITQLKFDQKVNINELGQKRKSRFGNGTKNAQAGFIIQDAQDFCCII
jgi:hypothetical protein